MSTPTTVVATITAFGAASLGGVFLAFATAVMPGLARRPGAEAAAAMQEINRVIVNPVFVLLFVGTGVAGLATVVLGVLDGQWLPAIGAALAVAAGHGITATVNIPLNTALDRSVASQQAWERFAGPWNRAHAVRTAGSLAGAAVLLVALIS